tara:strand:- start:349 stop:1269 length:921 start_codon:yes stop_codon:yes gene_type:complete
MIVIFINLSCYFFKPGIWRLNKIGITITHCGVMLILIGSALTYFLSIEGNMIIDEGGRSNYFENFYSKEFAVVNTSDKQYDNYTVFDEPSLFRGNDLSHSSLPFNINVIDYFVNCKPVQRLFDSDQNFQGMAKNFYLHEVPSEKDYEHNRPGIIYEISGADSTKDGIYMLFLGQSIPSTLNVADQQFDFILRPRRIFVPFEIELIDFEKVMHPGTEVAKSFSSEVNLIDNNVSRKVLIKMNEPLRHYDYTFYQASFIEDGDQQTTVLATVKNYGRMFPYISSIIMCIGILFHLILMMVTKGRRRNA